MTGPARITIEIEPARQRGRWVTRTRVEERGTRRDARTRPDGLAARPSEALRRWREDGDASFDSGFDSGFDAASTRVPEGMPVHVPEPREPAVTPAAYEPPTECTCVDGWCEADHENA